MRRLRFWIGYILRFQAALIVGQCLEPLVDRFGMRASFAGIRIVASPVGEGKPEPPFIGHTMAALRLIQSEDPRRFRRVQREIATVEDAISLSFAAYSRPGRRCRIDFTRVDPDKWQRNPEWYHWVYATSLVHEATHGALYSRHILYTPKLRARIERLCCAEARRFARCADREDRQWSDALVPPFDEKGWHGNWYTS